MRNKTRKSLFLLIYVKPTKWMNRKVISAPCIMAFEYQMALLPPTWETECGRAPAWKFRPAVGTTRARLKAMPWEKDATCKVSLDYNPPCLYKVAEELEPVPTAAGPRPALILRSVTEKTVPIYVERLSNFTLQLHISHAGVGARLEATWLSGKALPIVETNWSCPVGEVEDELLRGWTDMEKKCVRWVLEGQSGLLTLPRRTALGHWWGKETGQIIIAKKRRIRWWLWLAAGPQANFYGFMLCGWSARPWSHLRAWHLGRLRRKKGRGRCWWNSIQIDVLTRVPSFGSGGWEVKTCSICSNFCYKGAVQATCQAGITEAGASNGTGMIGAAGPLAALGEQGIRRVWQQRAGTRRRQRTGGGTASMAVGTTDIGLIGAPLPKKRDRGGTARMTTAPLHA